MPCIIFDFDGTLADTEKGITETFQRTLENMGRERVDVARIKGVIGLPLKQNFTDGADMADEDADRAVVIYRELFMDIALQTVTLFPGVKEALKALSDRKIPMAIASSRGEGSLRELSHFLGISEYIPDNHIFGVESVARPKPAPDMVYAILARLGAKPEETLVIGDTTFDIEMGRAAGAHTCGVTYGNQPASRLKTALPDYLVDDLRRLI
ncbi:MAG: HAD family hydrolase [Bacteroidales bacterium]|nr:HAD family hydrolase [Candidatus Cacconaster merdequi]